MPMNLYLYKRKSSFIYRQAIRQILSLYIDYSDKQCIVAIIEHLSLANYFYGIIGIAWLCEKMKIPLQFVFPREDSPFFEQTCLYADYSPKPPVGDHFVISDLRGRLASLARKVARKDLPAAYGQRVIARLVIKRTIQDQAEQWFNAHIHGRWVAVHYRGTDAHTHPRSNKRKMPIERYIVWLKEVIDNRCSIFACSDQAQFIDAIQLAFPGRVQFREINRSPDCRPLHQPRGSCYSHSEICRQRRDALMDLLILAKASLVYTTGSWFVDVVRHFNPKVGIISVDRRRERRSAQNYLPIPNEALL